MSGKLKNYWTIVKLLIKLKRTNKAEMKAFFKQLWATLFNRVVTNWRTTLAGILTAVLGWLLYDGVITSDVFGFFVMILGFLGIPIKDPRTQVKKPAP